MGHVWLNKELKPKKPIFTLPCFVTPLFSRAVPRAACFSLTVIVEAQTTNEEESALALCNYVVSTFSA